VDLVHAWLGRFGAGASQHNVANDSAGCDITDLIDVFWIQFDRDTRRELAFDWRDAFEFELKGERRVGVLESGQIVRCKVPRHQKLLRLELLLLQSDRTEDVDNDSAGLRQVQLGQFRHAECWIYR